MRLAEIFYSIQGEGRLVGTPSIFIRTSGCNLRCVWCDTPYTSWRPEGEEWDLREIVAEAAKYPGRHAVVTGGEPFLDPEIEGLTAGLGEEGYHVTIETAATLLKPVVCDLISMSPKLANSTPWKREQGRFARMHEQRRLNFAVMQRLMDGYDYQFKFVVERRRDFVEIEEVLSRLQGVDRSRVLVMAQGKSRKALREKGPWIVELCKKHGFSYTPRLHIELYGNRRGT
ncbi:MAG: 7-carboxy-7-deazaguanine synthase QueE [Deltaproteobacteria bacterium]|nr:7-carboxy-7-deazaguanine synthase QueE [Deltaproteobacteria bacterium]